jgi:hypothetical protein
VDQPHGRTSADDPSENPRACRGAAAVEEVAAERGSAAESKQCCSEWPSSASGAGRTAPELEVEASAAAGQYSGCSAPAGQNRCRCSWCSPSVCSRTKFMRRRYCAAAGMKLRKDMTEKRNIGFTPNVLTQFYYLVQVVLGSICMSKFNY